MRCRWRWHCHPPDTTQVNVLDNEDFRITDIQFKTIIASSLPASWDAFTEPYVGRRQGMIGTDPKKLTSSQEFIGIIKEEYGCHKNRMDTSPSTKLSSTSTYYSNTCSPYSSAQPNNRPLADHICSIPAPAMPATVASGTFCRNCRQSTHTTDNCKWLGQPKCNKCGWFGHVAAKCFRSGAQKRKYEGDQGGKQNRTGKKRKQAHCAAEDAHSGQTNEGIVIYSEATKRRN